MGVGGLIDQYGESVPRKVYMDLATSPIKELQAALFPVQPIPGEL